ncbi:hybrid sensor histidine kinase/response regulator [Lujinxingia vulgaris]|nr:ATP-binding protein [Lujinxingia vulgaris]
MRHEVTWGVVSRVFEDGESGVNVSERDINVLRAYLEKRSTVERLCEHKRAVVLVQDMHGTIRDCVGDTDRLFGMPATELIDAAPQSYTWRLLDEEGRAFAPEELPGRRAIMTGRVQEGLVGVALAEGEPVWVSLVCHPIFHGNEAIGLLTTLIDVSALQLTRQALAEVEARLREQHKMQAVERMAAAIAHDFNNLLSVVLSQTDCVLADYGGNPGLRADLLEIREATERAVELTQNLLAVGKVQHQAPVSLSLNGLMEEFTGLARVLMPGVSVDWRPGTLSYGVRADRSQLEQIVLNLMINASEAMEGKGRVVVRTEEVKTEGEVVLLLSIRDEGRGMTPEVAQRAFEPFFTTKAPGQGSGMGLATVYGVVSQSGGRVELETAPGAGTEVLVWLRAGEMLEGQAQGLDEETTEVGGAPQEEEVQTHPRETKRPSGSLSPLRRRQPTALVVLGRERDRRLVRKVLERRRFRVIDCALADEARCLVQIDAPLDVLICAQHLLDASGVELASELMKVRPGLGLVLVGGSADDAEIAATFTERPQVIAAPFDGEALQDAVERVMRSGEGRGRMVSG